MSNLHERPYGVGLAYRFNVHREAVAHRDEIDLLELPTEDYIVRERRIYSDPDESLLRDALATFPCLTHGLSLSIGTVEPLDQRYLEKTREFMENNGIEIFSEHLAYHRVDGNDLTEFLAMPFEEISVQWVKRNYYAARRALGRPFALENVTYDYPVPHCSLGEAEFLRRVSEETDCTFLLDVTNVFNNSHNHGYDPIEFFDRFPMDRVSQMHLAGGNKRPDGKWEDSHSAPVMEEVWPLFDEAVRRCPHVDAVILERDSKLHPFGSVMTDIRRAREIFYEHKSETPSGKSAVPGPSPDSVPEVGPDCEAPEFADLRGFQRATMARITDGEYQKAYRKDPEAALARFGISDPEWFRRARDSDPASIEEFGKAWSYYQEEDKEIVEDYRNREWSMWARQLGG